MRDEELLAEYQNDRKAARLILEYRELLTKLAHLCKGTYLSRDPLFTWFYGLFLNGKERTGTNILDARDTVAVATEYLTFEDCYNQVVCFFLSIAGRYKKQPTQNFHQYIRMVLPWRVKGWLTGCIEQVVVPEFSEAEYPEDTEPFKLDLEWVVKGSLNPLFRELRAYHRYLLYLYFTESMDIRRIAVHTHQSKNTVHSDLTKILAQCRLNFRE